jgi:hypothetical protein
MSTIEYEEVVTMARGLELRERLQLLHELLRTISTDVADAPSKHSIFELKGVNAKMWREINVDNYIREERASWDG